MKAISLPVLVMSSGIPDSNILAFCDCTVNIIASVIQSCMAKKTYNESFPVEGHPSFACWVITSVFAVRPIKINQMFCAQGCDVTKKIV